MHVCCRSNLCVIYFNSSFQYLIWARVTSVSFMLLNNMMLLATACARHNFREYWRHEDGFCWSGLFCKDTFILVHQTSIDLIWPRIVSSGCGSNLPHTRASFRAACQLQCFKSAAYRHLPVWRGDLSMPWACQCLNVFAVISESVWGSLWAAPKASWRESC